jgi:holin-like protein
MIQAAAQVLVLLVLGQVIVDWLSLPFPGSAVGLLMLVAIFAVRGGPDAGSAQLFDHTAPYFQFFFVPAAVGVIANLELIYASWAFIVVAIVLGTSLTLVCTGLIFQALLRRFPAVAGS